MRTSITALLALCLLAACGGDDDGDSAEHGDHDSPGNTPDASVADASQPDAGAAPCDVTIKLLDFELDPSDVDMKSGPITLCAQNDGKAPHDLAVRDADKKVLGKTQTLGPNESGRFSLDLDPASYAIFCTQAGHESLGMKGTLTIE